MTNVLAFDQKHYIDKGHALSWSKSPNEKALLRLKVISHFDKLLLEFLEKENNPVLKNKLEEFREHLKILSTENSLYIIYNLCREKFCLDEITDSNIFREIILLAAYSSSVSSNL